MVITEQSLSSESIEINTNNRRDIRIISSTVAVVIESLQCVPLFRYPIDLATVLSGFSV